ncbi:helix-turn-helix transcriptional regulator [Limosilactobacillus reuteri]|uniref:helix-turn-helix transcriptional regulator n=1 Tax=Limosilactobacillus reuteri TaxID=1598 RepID=UPI000A398251|nr:helix-turn-helix transcriptional regulator [Limosilactobacillus reuteri]MCC4348434.1 helix-turn-helix transcriptional regulator [Limosilactobacillus reuteri]MCC4372690.1 helix-turn-helix transcriptional regulator [Limosilactobacillus reuteri]MCC4375226.1 helix-turn-helix transcriptional regulator [Limosilactobacillus reuteri]MCC4385179.1 helix-turn-helix transcriptional regulator [Limosilactobacillus reuteri]MRI08110.1 helix-turn-helix domain-containing protein [Limosilactobacillus reuteri]
MTLSLKALRSNVNLSQDELGQKLGVSQTTISSWEQGNSIPSSKNIYKLAQLYSIDPTLIFNAIFKQKT